MTPDTLERLRAADPAHGLDPAAPEALLQALTAAPGPLPRRRTLRAARVLLPIVAAAAVAAGVVLVPGGSTDLAAQAYAQTAPQPEQILYVRTTLHETIEMPDRRSVETSTSEVWQRAGVSRRITRHGPGQRSLTEETLDADGVMRLRFDGGRDTARREDGAEQREYIDRVSSGFVANFRREYERGRLDESGETTFAGRPARRYVVTTKDIRQEYYLDAETGAPLGSEQVAMMYAPRFDEDGKPILERRGSGTATYVTTVEALDHLPPTPENLAKLGD